MERSRAVGIAGAVAVAWFLVATSAYAEAPADGLLRVGHLSPTTPAVDVYVFAEGGGADDATGSARRSIRRGDALRVA